MLRRAIKNNLVHFPSWKKIPKWLRAIIIILLSLIFLFIAFLGFVSWYVNANKAALLSQIKSVASEHLNGGNLHIKDIDIVFWKTFPTVSVELRDVTLSDSLYPQHQKNMFDFKYIYVKLKPLSILANKPQIDRVIVNNGHIYMFKDSTNYSNTNLFKTENTDTTANSDNQMQISKFSISNVQFVFDNFLRNKKFEIYINDIDGKLEPSVEALNFDIDLDVKVDQLGFNLEKGGFLQDTEVTGDLAFAFNKELKRLEVSEQTLKTNGMPLDISATFNLSKDNKDYSLILGSKKLDFSKGRAMLSNHIAQKLSKINVGKPVNIETTIDGVMQYPDTPKVVVTFNLENNVLKLDIGNINKAYVSGRFTNNFVEHNGLGNENSAVYIDKMKGEFEGVPLVMDSSYIVDFAQPKLYCNIKSSFPVEKLDDLAGASFNMKNGQADLNIFYVGPLTPNDPMTRSLNGYIHIKNASLSYLPRNLKFDNCNAKIEFKDQDVIFKQVTLNSKSTNINLIGIGHRFLSAYFNDQYKAGFDIQIKSPHLNLDEFKSFLAPRKSATTDATDNSYKFRKLNNQLDQALATSDMQLQLEVGKISYKKFEAKNFHANIDLLESGIALRNVHVAHAGGRIEVNGKIDQSSKSNPFHINANIAHVKINELFAAFDNFGLTTLQSHNIRGNFTGDININGGLDNSGNLLSKSLQGKVNFKLANGALINFAPLIQVQKYAFRGRNLSNVTFSELSNTLDINKGLITIHPMEIISSAIYLKVQGVYGIERGTDIFIEAPLRNPKKDEALLAKGRAAKRNRGIVIYLRAKDDGTGKVKLTWDPQKKGLKEQEWNNMDEKELEPDVPQEQGKKV